MIVQVLFFIEIVFGDENNFSWERMAGLTKDTDMPGSGLAVMKYTEAAKYTGFITKMLEWDLSVVSDLFLGLMENSIASGNNQEFLRTHDTKIM